MDGRRSAQLNLVFGSDGHLIVQFGVAVLDGCAPEDSVPVHVAGQPGRLRISGPRWSELIWPATLGHPAGIYGLSGTFSRRAILAMAESMPRVPTRPLLDAAC